MAHIDPNYTLRPGKAGRNKPGRWTRAASRLRQLPNPLTKREIIYFGISTPRKALPFPGPRRPVSSQNCKPRTGTSFQPSEETEVCMEVSSRRLAIVQHRHHPARGLLSLISLLRAFLLTGIKRNQAEFATYQSPASRIFCLVSGGSGLG